MLHWIQFDSSFYLERFLSAIGDYDSAVGSLHDRMLHGYDRIAGPRVGQWRYEITVCDWAVDEVDTDTGDVEIAYGGAPDFVVLMSLHFPYTDLPEVLERIRRFKCNP